VRSWRYFRAPSRVDPPNAAMLSGTPLLEVLTSGWHPDSPLRALLLVHSSLLNTAVEQTRLTQDSQDQTLAKLETCLVFKFARHRRDRSRDIKQMNLENYYLAGLADY